MAHETHLGIGTQPHIQRLRLRSHRIGHGGSVPGNRPCCRKGQNALNDGRGVGGGDIDESRPDNNQEGHDHDDDSAEKANAEPHGKTLHEMILVPDAY
jgi:hypothetical protein